MARLNVSVPDDLIDQARRAHPGMNVSKVLQDGLRSVLGCSHHGQLSCSTCGDAVPLHDLELAAVNRFYVAVMRLIADALYAGYTVEGVARVVRTLGKHEGVPDAERIPLPKLSRSQREHNRRPPAIGASA